MPSESCGSHKIINTIRGVSLNIIKAMQKIRPRKKLHSAVARDDADAVPDLCGAGDIKFMW